MQQSKRKEEKDYAEEEGSIVGRQKRIESMH